MKLQADKKQLQFILSKARFITFIAGRRYGKSVSADNRMIYKCVSNPGWRCMYLAPTYAQVIERFDTLISNPVFQKRIKKTWLQPYPMIELWNGSIIQYRSFERPKNIRGTYFNEVIVDESQDINEDDFWSVVRPLISDLNGNLILLGQFRGNDWRAEKFYDYGDPTHPKYDPQFESFCCPSQEGLRFQTPEGKAEIAAAEKQMYRPQFETEFSCKRIANKDAAFDPLDIERLKVNKLTGLRCEPLPCYQDGQANIMGLDLGRVVDQTAVVILDTSRPALMPVIHAEKMPPGMKHQEQAVRCAAISRKFNARVVIDATGGATGGHEKQAAYLQFYRQAIPDIKAFYWQQANKERIIHHLALQIQLRQLAIPPVYEEVYTGLLAYEGVYNPNN